MAETASSVEHVAVSRTASSCSATSESWNWKVLGFAFRVSERRRGMREGPLERMSLLRRTRRKARDSSRVTKSGTAMRCLNDGVGGVLEEESLSSADESIRTCARPVAIV